MLEGIIGWSIRQRWLVISLGLILAVAGLYAVSDTPMDAVPDLSENQVLVTSSWPGHSPVEIDQQITAPLTSHLSSIPGIRVVRGSSDIDTSLIHVIFEDGLTWKEARQRVTERLSDAALKLPAGVIAQLAPDAIPTGQIFWYTVEGKGLDLARLRSIQEWTIGPQLRSIPGVAEVASVGGFTAEYHVDLDPEQIQHYGLSSVEVSRILEQANQSVAGNVLVKANAEYIAHVSSTLSGEHIDAEVDEDPNAASTGGASHTLRTLEQIVVGKSGSRILTLSDIAQVHLGVHSRRGMLEKDGNEVVGGVVMLRQGHNPLDVTRQLKSQLGEIQLGLPDGARIIPCYDRTPLIEGAVGTVTGTLMEAVVTSTLCVLLILLHLRTSLVIAVTIPLAALGSFVLMWGLRKLGWLDVQTNMMSLAGIAISIGVLVDSSIVMAENVMHRLQLQFGDQPVRGDVRETVRQACCVVGRPMFFSVVIMVLSFLPVFALGGMDGKMFHPLAFTKTFALAAAALLSITLIPALCTILIRGRLKPESQSWIVRSVSEVYRPVLEYLLTSSGPLFWFLSVTLILGAVPLGIRWLFLGVLAASLIMMALTIQKTGRRIVAMLSIVSIALVADRNMHVLGSEVRMPLNEGMVMDMPITVPRASVVQSGDDVKARDMQLCRFPEVHMVIGKAGRVESPFDPAPLDMIETMIEFRPEEWWPRRRISQADGRDEIVRVLYAMRDANLIGEHTELTDTDVIDEVLMLAMRRYDGVMREYVYQRHQSFVQELGRSLALTACRYLCQRANSSAKGGPLFKHPQLDEVVGVTPESQMQLAMSPQGLELSLLYQKVQKLQRQLDDTRGAKSLDQQAILRELGTLLRVAHSKAWKVQVALVDQEVRQRASETFVRIVELDLASKVPVLDATFQEILTQIAATRRPPALAPSTGDLAAAVTHHGGLRQPLPLIDPHEVWDPIRRNLVSSFTSRLVLRKNTPDELAAYGGELDTVLQMPGWTNVWTKPIQNRVDMLATGVNTEVGIRVLGANLNTVVRVSEEIAEVMHSVPGAADVVADPIRGKGYLDVKLDLAEAARRGIPISELNGFVEIALGGKHVGTILEGRNPMAIRLRMTPRWTQDEETLADLPISFATNVDNQIGDDQSQARPTGGPIRLGDVAKIQITEGPATIKREQGWLRNYVRLNVRERDILEFLPDAKAAVANRVRLPEGVFVEWTGQFEHTIQTANTLKWVMPVVVMLILGILFWTYGDWMDTWMMLLAVPGALAGGVLFQWLFDYKFSIPVAVGYIACFGMATSTGIIMLVYLREAVEKAGGVSQLTPETLRTAVLNGAVQRLRPKLLTEGTTILGLAPMLWATGVGAEVIRPMAAPVLGGLLLADEVIDLLLPVLFYWSRLRRLTPSVDSSSATITDPVMSQFPDRSECVDTVSK